MLFLLIFGGKRRAYRTAFRRGKKGHSIIPGRRRGEREREGERRDSKKELVFSFLKKKEACCMSCIVGGERTKGGRGRDILLGARGGKA